MLKKLVLLLSVVLSVVWVGQAQTIRNTSNSALLVIDDKGAVRTTGNSLIARIESNGTIRDKGNSVLGKIESDGTVRDAVSPFEISTGSPNLSICTYDTLDEAPSFHPSV